MKRYIVLLSAAMLSLMPLMARENFDRSGKFARDFEARRKVVTDNGYFDVFATL